MRPSALSAIFADGDRLIDGFAHKMGDDFFARFQEAVEGPAPEGDGPEDGDAAATAADKAADAGVHVIAYDRLIKSTKIAAYVSFNNIEVGRQQALGVMKAGGCGPRVMPFTSSASSVSSTATPTRRTASSAPTTITEETALVTDMRGVCSAGVTLQTT